MSNFESLDKFIVRQQKEWGEILTGFEVNNKYKIFDVNGREIFFAFEQKSNWFVRQFLKAARPFTLEITDPAKNIILEVKRPFRWIFQEASFYDSNHAHIATMKMEWAWFQRRYDVFGPDNTIIFKLLGPFLKPWTFHIIEDGRELGKITKKWSGALKEIFTKADNFGAEFPLAWPDQKKAAVLGALLLIDVVHFERKG